MSRRRTSAAGAAGAPDPPVSAGHLESLVAVLDEVRAGRAQTRPELVAETGFTRAVVAQRVSELMARGLIEEGELGVSARGRAPRMLRFRSDSGHVLSAALGATSLSVALTDLSAEPIEHHEEPADIADGPEVVLGRVQELFDEMLERHAGLPGRLWGIGIGVPGPVEFSSGRPTAPPIMPGWDRFPVRERFAEKYDVPVWVDNDVNVMALGEVRAGAARNHELVVFIKMGTGIGAGIVTHGRLLRGAQGCAGDVGHIHVTDDPSVICRCGNVGCLEAIAGGAAVGRRAEAAAREGHSPLLAEALAARGAVNAEDVARAASHGDTLALGLITEAGQLVGGMLASLVNILNPSLVVIGGGFAKSGEGLLAAVRHTVYGRSLPLATRDLLIQRSTLERAGGVIGAASMVMDELFTPVTLAVWLESGYPAARQLAHRAA